MVSDQKLLWKVWANWSQLLERMEQPLPETALKLPMVLPLLCWPEDLMLKRMVCQFWLDSLTTKLPAAPLTSWVLAPQLQSQLCWTDTVWASMTLTFSRSTKLSPVKPHTVWISWESPWRNWTPREELLLLVTLWAALVPDRLPPFFQKWEEQVPTRLWHLCVSAQVWELLHSLKENDYVCSRLKVYNFNSISIILYYSFLLMHEI